MIKQMLIFSVIGLLLVVPFVIYDINAQIPSQVEILNPPQTCGISYPSLATLDYGQIRPNEISNVAGLSISHTGNYLTVYDVYGTNWVDPVGTTIMSVDATHWTDLPFIQNTYDSKSPLTAWGGGFPYTLLVGGWADLEFQVKAVLLDPTFEGTLSQTVTIVFECYSEPQS